jgi:hypothetical protein
MNELIQTTGETLAVLEARAGKLSFFKRYRLQGEILGYRLLMRVLYQCEYEGKNLSEVVNRVLLIQGKKQKWSTIRAVKAMGII